MEAGGGNEGGPRSSALWRWVQAPGRNRPKSCHPSGPTPHPAVAVPPSPSLGGGVTGDVLALSWDVSQLCHRVPGAGGGSCRSPALGLGEGAAGGWERAGGERGARGTGRAWGAGGWLRGTEGTRGGAGGTAWACPFKRRCLLSGFGTQPLSCLRLQRRRIKGLFHLSETLSPASRGAASPRASPSLPGVVGSCPCCCPGDAAAPGPVLGTPGDSRPPARGHEATRTRGRERAQPCPRAPGTGLNCCG